jgi:prepilin-type N-terminal cleavage/methylation domain-containing protein
MWRGAERGFSLVEMLVATAILVTLVLMLFQAASAGQGIARAQPEAADLRQRLRVAADIIQRDLLMAGAAIVHGADAGPLISYLPPIQPARVGATRADPALSFFTDRMTVVYAPMGAVAAPLLADMPAPAADVAIDSSATGCPSSGLCGFADGTRALIFDRSGVARGFELFSVTGTPGALSHGAPDPAFSRAYAAGAALVIPVRQRVYYLDAAAKRLMAYDGYATDVPLVDNIVSLSFAYFIDPAASSAPRPPDGEGNCVYAAGNPPVPLLTDYGGAGPVAADASVLTDGPVCGLPPNQFDGDLLRLRRIRVTIRAQVGDAALRGRGADFATPGVSTHGNALVPDADVTFDVVPRNLTPRR